MYKSLDVFRANHGLQSTPGNIFVNVGKETLELYDEILAMNELGIICELCDHVIYPINILEALGHDAKSNIEQIKAKDSPILDRDGITPTMAVSCIMMALSNYNLEKDIRALALIARIALNALESLGYNAEKCVLEKCKTINSREGAYNPKLDKWCKNPKQDKATLYAPDYPSCKLGEG